MTGHALHGVLPVFQTPYHDDESVDFATLQREIDWLYERGADGIVMAMVSETLRLSSEEREQLAEHACRHGAKQGVVVISVGAESSRLMERFARHAQSSGATAVMAIPPVTVAASESELLRYYERLIESTTLPVIIQDASGYVGRPMTISMQARLLEQFGERVMYKPEAVPIGPRLTALLDATAGKARIFEGSGGIALVESFRRGAIGTMPGADLIEGIVRLWRALVADDQAVVDRLFPLIAAIVSLQNSLDAFLAVEKYLLVKQGVFRSERVRGPVGYQLDDATRAQIDHWFQKLQSALDQT
jgi:4-hydroxy-tetrahydrodipicolinate synthase